LWKHGVPQNMETEEDDFLFHRDHGGIVLMNRTVGKTKGFSWQILF